MGATPSTGNMKAVVRANGTLAMNAEWPVPPDPKPDTNGVIIRVRAAAINPVDYKLPKFVAGAIAGYDVAGVIEKIAEGTTTHDFKVGDEVFGRAIGSLAEFAASSGSTLARKPKELSFVEAASMNITYVTGLLAFTTYGGLKEGGRVLIIGASGGTGTAGIQIAKALKAGEIVAVCSGKNEEMVRNLGATKVVDYKTTKFVDVYGEAKDEEKFDVVYDCASYSGHGEDYVQDSQRVLKVGPPAGQYVPINGSKTMWMRCQLNLQPANTNLFVCKTSTQNLDAISKLVAEEGLRPVIAETLPFTAKDVEIGYEHLKGRRTVGKIVFDMTLPGEESKSQEHAEDVKTQNAADAQEQPASDTQVKPVADSPVAKAEELPGEQVKPKEPVEDAKTQNVVDAEEQHASDTQRKPIADSPVKAEKLPAEVVKAQEPVEDGKTQNVPDAEQQSAPGAGGKTVADSTLEKVEAQPVAEARVGEEKLQPAADVPDKAAT